MPLNSGLCSLDGWDLDRSCMDIPADTPEEVIERWRQVAAELLFALTGNRFGPSCPVVVRPCRKSCADSYSLFNQGQFLGAGYRFTGPFLPYMAGGRMYNASLCGCVSECHCGPELCEVYLPGPIYDITSVTINGDTVPTATYNILDGQYLVRSSASDPEGPGGACWPGCQDMSLPAGSDNTFVVTYRTGIPVPALGVAALSALTAHYIKGCNGCGCGVANLQNVRSLQRQGVSMEFADAQQVLGDGRTGIEVVDQFIHAYNPGRLTHAMRVLSPDAPRRPRIWYGPGV